MIMAKTSWMTETQRHNLAVNLFNEGPITALEAIRAHFESHPTMPGEKAVKDRVIGLLDNPELLIEWDPSGEENKNWPMRMQKPESVKQKWKNQIR